MATTRALTVPRPGDSSVLEVREVDLAPPGAGEVTVEVAAVGVNFIDVYQRQGIYPLDLPFVSCNEGAGIVVGLGDGVTTVEVGDRVAWGAGVGSAATLINRAANAVVPVPSGVDLEVAAAVMLQGMTAHYLVNSTYVVRSGTLALVHAAAGGVGQLLVQMVKNKGGTVIGTAGGEKKMAVAERCGADFVLDSGTPDLADAVVEITGRRGVDVAYDGVGRATFEASLASLRTRGMLVLFGAASGTVPPFDLQRLNQHGSLFVTRPSLGHYIATPEELTERASAVFASLAAGELRVDVASRYALGDASMAYDALEGRRSSGKMLLIP